MPVGQQYGSNAPQTSLVGGINNSQATATVNSFTGYPATPFTGVFDIGTPTQEIVDILGVSGNSITNMTRGVDGSSAQAHSNNATFTHVQIARDLRETRAHMDASASNDSLGFAVHGLVPGSSVVGTTDTQVLTNKTLTNPTITGLNAANASLTGTVTGAAQYQNITVGTTAVGSTPLTISGLTNETANLLTAQHNATTVFSVGTNGATGGGNVTVSPTDTGHIPLAVNAPSGLTSDIARFRLNGVDKVFLDSTGQLVVSGVPLSLPLGVTGAAVASRYVGATAGGAPTTGTFITGDWVVDTVNAVQWVCIAGGTPGTWSNGSSTTISETVLGGTTTTVTLSAIPGTYKHLRLHIMGRSAAAINADNVYMQVNGDTGTNYIQRSIGETNAANNAGAAWGIGGATTATGFIGALNGNGAGGGEIVLELPGYSNATFNKLWHSTYHCGPFSTGAHSLGLFWNIWNNTAAVTSITLGTNSGSGFAAGTIFSLVAIP